MHIHTYVDRVFAYLHLDLGSNRHVSRLRKKTVYMYTKSVCIGRTYHDLF